VSAAAQNFVNSFDDVHDRIALTVYSDGGKVLDAMQTTNRGYNKSKIDTDIANHGSMLMNYTAMAEGLYRAYDELEAVSAGNQSTLRVLVLFTDGCANGVPGNFSGLGNTGSPIPSNSCGIFGYENGSTMIGLTDSLTFLHTPQYYTTTATGGLNYSAYRGITLQGLQHMPAESTHGGPNHSTTVPLHFPLQSHTLTVDGSPQDAVTVRGMDVTNGNPSGTPAYYEANVHNVNNAARNLVEIIANDARARYAGNTNAPYPIRIYTIGMGPSLKTLYGTRPEYGEDILRRAANDPASPDHISSQLDGRYFYAPNAASVQAAFAELKSELLRLSQ
jgi:hypothetical protein